MERATEDNKSRVAAPGAFPDAVTKLRVVCVKHEWMAFLAPLVINLDT